MSKKKEGKQKKKVRVVESDVWNLRRTLLDEVSKEITKYYQTHNYFDVDEISVDLHFKRKKRTDTTFASTKGEPIVIILKGKDDVKTLYNTLEKIFGKEAKHE